MFNNEGENFVGMVEGKREISSSPSEGENFVEMLPLLSANLAIALQTDQATERFTPQSYKQAVECEDCEEWIKAMMREINAHLDNQTWTMVPPQSMNAQDRKHHMKVRSIWSF